MKFQYLLKKLPLASVLLLTVPVFATEPGGMSGKKGDTRCQQEESCRDRCRVVCKPKWNLGTNLLEWIGVMPDLRYTTVAPNLHGEFYFARRYSIFASAAFSDFDYSAKPRHQGFTSYVIEPRVWLRGDSSFKGLFAGIYGQFGDYNDINPSRKYTGHFWGAGISAGYLYPVWKGLALEFNVKAGYRNTEIKEYVFNQECDRCLDRRFSRNRFVLSGFALNVSWRF